MKTRRRYMVLFLAIFPGLTVAADPTDAEVAADQKDAEVAFDPKDGKTTVAFESVEASITAKAFPIDFPQGDCSYHSLVQASDGFIYFTANTHNLDYACRLYRFEPDSGKTELIGKLDEVLGEDATQQISQGKIHTRIYEHRGKLWFATHTSFYKDVMAGIDSGEKRPYEGGHFVNYDLSTGQFQDVAKAFPSEGIMTMVMDPEKDTLYGLTWPSGIFISYDLAKSDLRLWGGLQEQGDHICRCLAIDPDGYVYGCLEGGAIWKYDASALKRVNRVEGLDLSRVPFTHSTEEARAKPAYHMWRAIEWNPNTESFWGLHFGSTTLFEFTPQTGTIRAVAKFRNEASQEPPINPYFTQLGFMIGPQNTIFYFAHGPAVEMKERPALESNLYLYTYAIDEKKFTDHGPIFTTDGRRVFFSESIAIGRDDHIYSVPWIEVTDPGRREILIGARKEGAPAETEKAVYETEILQLPRWQEFVN